MLEKYDMTENLGLQYTDLIYVCIIVNITIQRASI